MFNARCSVMFVPCLGCGLSWLLLLSTECAQGVEVVDSGKRRWVDTHWFRGNSYFRIGWDWVKAVLLNGWKLLHSVAFSGNQDPTPAIAERGLRPIASLKQHEQRLYQLEFEVQTHSYNIS